MVAICYQRQYGFEVMNQHVQYTSLQEKARYVAWFFGGWDV
jgi:hypothetical protein